MLADLHTHSTFSDGKYTPEELVKAAIDNNIRYLAVTDHDSCNGVAEAQKIAANSSGKLSIITGVELGTQYFENSVHILGYFININNMPLKIKMDEMRHAREHRLQKMLAKLKTLGYEVEVEACDPVNRAVGRPHVAKALVKKGYFASVQEVFDRLLRQGGPAYVPQPKLSPEEAINLLHDAGGIAVLAHPSELNNKELVDEILDKFAFDGLEVYHPSADAADTSYWRQAAASRDLLVSGGSDFHGLPDRYPDRLGVFRVHCENISVLKGVAK